MKQRTIWLLSPYHTGSHKAWAEGYLRHSRHRVILLTMAGRFWKWRMQGGAIEMAAQTQLRLAGETPPDAILATDMLNLPAWLGLLRDWLPPHVPVILYMHENQLTYPWRPGEAPDLTYGMINWLSQLAANHVIFNSRFHLDSWFSEVPRLLKHFPDYNHLNRIDEVARRSAVLPVGIDCPINNPPLDNSENKTDPQTSPPTDPMILWNQRWEYDKRPDRFFALLYRLHDEGYPFKLAVAGENFRNAPHEFEEAHGRLAEQVVHWGFVPDQEAYRRLLGQADLVISTSDHEFFGVSVLEAMAAGAFPLLPNRLSYPELIPSVLHPDCIYSDEADLYTKAARWLAHPRLAPPLLREHIHTHYDWPVVASSYDTFLEACIEEAQA